MLLQLSAKCQILLHMGRHIYVGNSWMYTCAYSIIFIVNRNVLLCLIKLKKERDNKSHWVCEVLFMRESRPKTLGSKRSISYLHDWSTNINHGLRSRYLVWTIGFWYRNRQNWPFIAVSSHCISKHRVPFRLYRVISTVLISGQNIGMRRYLKPWYKLIG